MDGDLTTAPAFRRVVRGYDPDAVDAWAATAAATVARLRRELAEARAQEAARQQAQHELVRTMTSAHLMAERLVEETQEEAARRREASVQEADRMLTLARTEAQELVVSARERAGRELAALEVERTTVLAELSQLRALLRDERLRAREGLANALGIVEASLGYTDGHGTVAAQVTTLSVVAS